MKDHLNSTQGGQEETLGEILLEHGLLTKEQLHAAEADASERHMSVEDVIREEGLVTDELIEQAIAQHYNVADVEQKSLLDSEKQPSVKKTMLRFVLGKKRVNKYAERQLQKEAQRQKQNEKQEKLQALRRIENERVHQEYKKQLPSTWAEREELKRKRTEERQKRKGGSKQSVKEETKEEELRQSFHVFNITGKGEKVEEEKRSAEKGKRWGLWLASSILSEKQKQKEGQKMPAQKKVRPRTSGPRFSIGKFFGAAEPEERKAKAEHRVERLKHLEQKQSTRLQKLAEKQAVRNKHLEEKQKRRQAINEAREEHRRMKAEIREKKLEAKQTRKESARRAQEEKQRLREEVKAKKKAAHSAKTKEYLHRFQEHFQASRSRWEAFQKALDKKAAEKRKKREKIHAEQLERREEVGRAREEKRKAREEARQKKREERQATREAAARAHEEKRKKRAEEKRKAAEAKQRKKEAKQQAKEVEKKKKEQERTEMREKKLREAEGRRAKIQAKKAARSSGLKAALGTMFSHRERASKKPEKIDKEALMEEAKQEALRQVLVEQQKKKLWKEQEAPQQELAEGPAAGEAVQAAAPPRAQTSTQTTPDMKQEREELAAERDRLAKERAELTEERDKLLKEAKEEARAEVEKEKYQKEKPTASVTPSDLKAIEEGQKKLEEERAKLEEEQKRLEVEKEKYQKEKEATPVTPSNSKAIEDAQKKLEEERKKFEEEKKALEKSVTAPESAGKSAAIEEAQKKLSQERAAFESEKAIIMDKARKEALAEVEKERTQFEIDKERLKQQALAEAQTEALQATKGKGLFGFKQRKSLQAEIEKWKKEAGKLEKERLELERMRALQEEQGSMREQRHQIEEQKVKLERDRVAQEMTEIELEDAYKDRVNEEEGKLDEDRKKLEETKKRIAEEKSKKEKPSKKKKKEKKKEGEEIVEPEEEKIDIGKILKEQNYIEEAELQAAEKKAKERNVSVEHILKEEGLVTKQLILNAIAEYYQMPFIDLNAYPPNTSVVELLPEETATTLNAIAIDKKEDGTIVVVTSNPGKKDVIEQIVKESIEGSPTISLAFTSKEAILSSFAFYRKPLNTRFRQIIEEHKKIAPEIIEELFADAIQLGASDIHFEPREKEIIVRFRVDGVMHEAGRIPKEYYEGIVNRIKIAGNMRIDEHFAAQDGAIRWKGGGRAMDVRVSIVPIVDGEKIVMRLLSEYVRTLTLTDLGFTNAQLTKLAEASHKPFGMVLTTGPTGSGKSTTLYGLLKIRNSPDVNISTIEDPVEYKIPGINHIQVNPKSNLTFERGLRALVRQDPDIILVGEIRDNITAQISVNAALTGHLLFSTLHANDAATAVPRLLEMEIEPFLLASTLELIIAQRLMRRTCNQCRYSYSISHEDACQLFHNAEKYFTDQKEVTLYKGKGCKACGETGYKGRVGVYELLVITPEIEELIIKRRTSREINAVARSQGMLTLFEDGLLKARSGLSTVEELLRIAAPPEKDINSSEATTKASSR